MLEVRMTGLGTYLPRDIVDNQRMPPLDPPITLDAMDRLGILSRGRAADDEDVLTMALGAAERALSEAQVEARDLDFLILANWTERRYVPDFAPRIQDALGARRAFAFDVCGACCGFVFGLSIAQGYLQNPRYRRGLVVASDRSSRRMRPGTRATLVFGDAAAAAVVEREASRGARLLDFELHSDGSQHGIMDVDADGYLRPHIKQQDLRPLAARTMTEACLGLLDRQRLSLSDIDWVVPHSGTAGIQATMAEHLGIARDKVLTNLPVIGNVTTASVPCALRHFKDLGTIAEGDVILSVAVGLGWHYAAMLLVA